MIIMYRKGEVVQQITAWGADRPKPMEELEALMIVFGAVALPERRRPGEGRSKDDDEDSLEDDEDDGPRNTNTKNIRRKADDQDDTDDFEFDM